jgi:spore coat assembly protein SafA
MSQKIHIVESGESLWKIAKQYGVDLDELIEANPQLDDPNKIYPGDGIHIPGEGIDAIEEIPAEQTPSKSERNWRPARVILRGRMSTFGGPGDTGVGPAEGLALVDENNFELFKDLFLPQQPPETTGLARRLNPEKFYLACRWNYQETPKEVLAQARVQVRNPLTDMAAYARPVDYGPALWTGKAADLSPGLARHLNLETDDEVEVSFSPGALIISPEPVEEEEAEIYAAPTAVFSEAQIKKHFGSFSFREDYSQKGAWIIINPPWEADNITKVFIPCLQGVLTYGNTRFNGWVRCHKKIAADLQAAFAEIKEQDLKDRILFWSGSHAPRHKNHDRNRGLSPHSWGIALDLNHQWNQYGDPPAEEGDKGSVMELVPIFEQHGFYWGGNFGDPDGMHFEYARVPADKESRDISSTQEPAKEISAKIFPTPDELLPDPHKPLTEHSELQLLAMALFGEARGTPAKTRKAIGHVIINRALHPGWWGKDLKGVILKPRQFSCFNEDDVNRKKLLEPLEFENPEVWERCCQDAIEVYQRFKQETSIVDPIKGANHYFDTSIPSPSWADDDKFVLELPSGRPGHGVRFYKL